MDPIKAAAIYEQNSGKNPQSALTLAKMLLKGDEIPKNPVKAISLLEQAKAMDPDLAPTVDYLLGTTLVNSLAEKFIDKQAELNSLKEQAAQICFNGDSDEDEDSDEEFEP